MSIIRSARPERYTLLDNVVFSSSLSFRALGLLSYLLSKPAHWEVSVAQLVNYVKDSKKPEGRDSIYAIINELIDAGFIVRKISRKEGGKMNGYEYHVFDSPQEREPYTDSTHTDEPHTVNPTQVNTEDPVTTKQGENTEQIGASAPVVFAESKQAADLLDVFIHWKNVMGKPKAKLDDKRKQLIRRSLKSYTTDELKKAIDGCKASDWHMGKNPNGTKYNELSLILRDSEKIDGFMERVGASRPRSAHTGFQPEDYQGMEYVSPGAEEWLNGGDHG